MRTALSAAFENGELFALYQPQVSADGLRVVSAEALLRWSRPGLGLVQPDDVVSYAETNEMIEQLGMFMLERACIAAAAWGGLPVSINVSPLQFARPDLAQVILETAAKASLTPRQLEIEITETAAFADMQSAAVIVKGLRAQGVQVALDDLGSGFASPSLMRALPLDRVKLGKAIVDKTQTPEGADEVASLVQEARCLGLNVTAEGVETHEQLARLRDLGCDRIQGFLFARPMTGSELSDYARALAPAG